MRAGVVQLRDGLGELRLERGHDLGVLAADGGGVAVRN